MIVVRSPLRITLGGGATDLPSYYQVHGGFCIGAAINKYVYVVLNRHFASDFIAKYSKTERVTYAQDCAHPIIREVFSYLGSSGCGWEMACLSDVPAGTGLGSSSSFTAGLIKAVSLPMTSSGYTAEALARATCDVELGRLKEPIGKQDQYAATHGGIHGFMFHKDGAVTVRALSGRCGAIPEALRRNLRLVFTGFSRSASAILLDQHNRADDEAMLSNLHAVKLVGEMSWDALEAEDYGTFAKLLTRQHELKNERCGINAQIEALYQAGMANGARGGRLLGAGGGGFLMFYVGDHHKFSRWLGAANLVELKFDFDWEGTKVVANE